MKQIILAIVVVVIIVAGLFAFCNRGTDPEIQKTVDRQYHELSLRLVDLAEPTTDNYQSLAKQLDSIRWVAVEDGRKYEKQKKELYLGEKRKIAESIRKYYIDDKVTVIPYIIENPDDIKE